MMNTAAIRQELHGYQDLTGVTGAVIRRLDLFGFSVV
jgi:hypothetical protein